MTVRPYPSHRIRSNGFTLVELLVTLVLGLLLTAAVTSVFLSSRQSFRTGEGVAQVQEEGRFASLLMAPIIRQAGYLNDPINQTDPTLVFSATLGKRAVFGFENVAPTAGLYNGFSATNVVAGTDSIAVAYMGRSATIPVADTPLKTCFGTDVLDTQIAINLFYIAQPAGDTTPSLYCYQSISPAAVNAAAGTTAVLNQPLVAGVRDMQILYGLDTDADGSANQYRDAGNVTDWTQVSSVQITYTVDSTDRVEANRADSTGSAAINGVIGGRIRRTFNTTIQIRNRLRQ